MHDEQPRGQRCPRDDSASASRTIAFTHFSRVTIVHNVKLGADDRDDFAGVRRAAKVRTAPTLRAGGR
jgi:hypothetical protein